MAIWNGSQPLHRAAGVVQPGETFTPTDVEQAAFGDLIIEESGAVGSPEPPPPAPTTEEV